MSRPRPREPLRAQAALRAAIERALAADLNVTEHRALLVLVHQIALFDHVDDAIPNSVVQRLGRLDERRARRALSRLDQLAVITRVPGRSTSAEGRIASRVSFDTAGRSDPGAIETPGPLDPGVLEDADPGSETTRTPGLQRPASEVLSEVLSEEQNARTVEPSTTSHSTVDEQSFDVFWTSYPKRNGQRLGRAKALTAWAKLNTTERSAAIAAIDAYTAASKGWPKDCERYLRDRLFADVDLDATNSGTTVGADRSDRIAAFLATPEPPALPEARVG